MTIEEYANRIENRSGYYTEKLSDGGYRVYHGGLSQRFSTISGAKRLVDYVAKEIRAQHSLRELEPLAQVPTFKVQSESDYTWLKHCSPQIFR